MYASDYRRIAREKLSGKWFLAVLVGFLATLLGGASSSGGISFNFNMDEETIKKAAGLIPQEILTAIIAVVAVVASVGVVVSIIFFVLGSVVQVGYASFHLNLHDGGGDVRDLFSYFGSFGKCLVLRILTSIFTALWSILFIIPGIVAGYSYAMAPYILAENPQMSANEAIRASKELMRGHKWRLFCLDMSFIGWHLLTLVTFGLSELVIGPYQAQAHAVFYKNLNVSSRLYTDPEI